VYVQRFATSRRCQAQQRRRSDEKRAPARLRQQPAGRGEEDPVGGAQLRRADLAAQHCELVAQHDDLEFLEPVRAKAQRRELQNASKYEVAERPEQETGSPENGGTGARLYG
jgi:hypothetical protein